MSFTRRGWLATSFAAAFAALAGLFSGRAQAAPPAPPKRKRWIGHY
jgi:hypothetical protein